VATGVGAYGKDGYVLCNYIGNQTEPNFLAAVCVSVINNAPHSTIWASGTNDNPALAPNSNNQTPEMPHVSILIKATPLP